MQLFIFTGVIQTRSMSIPAIVWVLAIRVWNFLSINNTLKSLDQPKKICLSPTNINILQFTQCVDLSDHMPKNQRNF